MDQRVGVRIDPIKPENERYFLIASRTAGRVAERFTAPVRSSSGVCRASLRDCREIGISDPRLQVPPDSVRCFVVAPFDVLASRLDKCGYAAIGGRWPSHPVSLA